jgi:hypothetical protein
MAATCLVDGYPQRDLATGVGKIHRVREEVRHDLLHARLVRPHVHAALHAARVHAQHHLVGGRLGTNILAAVAARSRGSKYDGDRWNSPLSLVIFEKLRMSLMMFSRCTPDVRMRSMSCCASARSLIAAQHVHAAQHVVSGDRSSCDMAARTSAAPRSLPARC